MILLQAVLYEAHGTKKCLTLRWEVSLVRLYVIWVLKGLKALGCSITELVTVYIRLVRSVCEYALPYWGTMISKQESKRIEHI